MSMHHHLSSRSDDRKEPIRHFLPNNHNKLHDDDDDTIEISGLKWEFKRWTRLTSCKLLFLLTVYVIFMHSWTRFISFSSSSSSSSPHNKTQSLLGILLVGKADIYTLQDWMHRHVELFETLVVIDGTESEWARDLILSYDDLDNSQTKRIYWLDEASLNLTKVNDQSLRAPAMSILGDPVGKWIMICHPDEFFVMDPRELVDLTVRKHKRVNRLRLSSMCASPLESTYIQTVQRLANEPELLYNGSFHIQDVSNMTFHQKSILNNGAEDRLFQWQEGMHWGDRHSLVVPEFVDAKKSTNYINQHVGFFVHFKMHDFSQNAIRGNGYQFANSKLKTGVHNHSDTEGWMGQFLDVSFPDALKKYPPRLLEKAIQEECRKWKHDSLCSLPLNTKAKFTAT